MFLLSLLYLVLTIIRPQDYLPGLTGMPVLPVVLVLAFLAWLGSAAKTFAAPQFMILPVFLLVLMISEVVNGWSGGALDELAKFGPTVVAFFVLAAACTSQHRVKIAMAVFVLCACVLALHGVEQADTGVGWTGIPIGEDGRIQYVGIFNDPNDLGLLFAATLPMAVFLSNRSGFFGRLFWLAATALLLYGTYLTNSRGAMLSVLVIAGIYIWRRRGMVTAGVLGIIGLAGMQLLSARMQDLDVDDESAHGRVDAWYSGLHMFMSHPVFGVGAGNFTDYNDLTAHNSFVLVLAETGFVGYILWLAFVSYGFLMMLAVLRYKPIPATATVLAPTPTPTPTTTTVAAALAARMARTAKTASTTQALEPADDWHEESTIAFTLLLSLCGLFTSAFFLSRSYTVVMYLLIAVVVGYYLGVRQRFPELPAFRLSESWWRWVPAAVGSIILMFVMVAVLLRGT